MAKAMKLALSAANKIVASSSSKLVVFSAQSAKTANHVALLSRSSHLAGATLTSSPRLHSTLSTVARSTFSKRCTCLSCSGAGIRCGPTTMPQAALFSTEVDKELTKFLEKEIQYETSRSSPTLPSVKGFEVSTDGGDVTFNKSSGSEKVVVRLSVNGAVDSIVAEGAEDKQAEPPQMVCRPPFEVEISKGDGTVLALQCAFPSAEENFIEGEQQGAEQIDDQFEIQEVAIHGGEWKDTTFSVSAATMDAELFDLLMDLLDERGVNDEFIAQLVDYCTAYENKQYIGFLNSLKTFSEK